MLGAGLLAKKAVEAGLSVLPYIKTSLSPGSGVVTYYLRESGVIPALEQLGFNVVGYGCMTCIGNSGPLEDNIVNTIEQNNLGINAMSQSISTNPYAMHVQEQLMNCYFLFVRISVLRCFVGKPKL